MFGSERRRDQLLLAVAVAAAGLIHISIAASQVLLGVDLLLMLFFHYPLRVPRIWPPLAAFFTWTLIADLLCPDPWTGRAQIKKFFVFLFIPLLFSIFVRRFSRSLYVLIAWTIAGTASGLLGLAQFISKYEAAQQSRQDFYVTYVGHRITGFESHWMTFGALQLSVLCLVLAQLLFSDRKLPAWILSLSVTVLSLAILLGETRSIWIATVPAVLYLIWCWRPRMTLALPLVLIVGFALAPEATRQRLTSLISPHGETDSNRHRVVTFRTGLKMVEAHPWFGLGPEEIGRQFKAYVPTDIARPLPIGYYGHLHNLYLQFAAERGIPSLLALLWFITLTLYDCLRAIKQSRRAHSLQLCFLHSTVAVIIGVLVGGFFEYNLGDSEVLMMFVSVIALGYAAAANVVAPRHSSPSSRPQEASENMEVQPPGERWMLKSR